LSRLGRCGLRLPAPHPPLVRLHPIRPEIVAMAADYRAWTPSPALARPDLAVWDCARDHGPRVAARPETMANGCGACAVPRRVLNLSGAPAWRCESGAGAAMVAGRARWSMRRSRRASVRERRGHARPTRVVYRTRRWQGNRSKTSRPAGQETWSMPSSSDSEPGSSNTGLERRC